MRLSKFLTKLAKQSGEDIAIGVVVEVAIGLITGVVFSKIDAAKTRKRAKAETHVGDEVVATAEVEDK